MKTKLSFFHIKETVTFPIHWKIQQSRSSLAISNNSEGHQDNSIPATPIKHQNTSHMNMDHPTNPPGLSPNDGMDFPTSASALFPKRCAEQDLSQGEPLAAMLS